jgi:hypothetical protein
MLNQIQLNKALQPAITFILLLSLWSAGSDSIAQTKKTVTETVSKTVTTVKTIKTSVKPLVIKTAPLKPSVSKTEVSKTVVTKPVLTKPVVAKPVVIEHSAEEIKKGKMLFVKATCWGCHPRGDNSLNGDKPLKGPGFTRRYKDDEDIVKMVRAGSVTRGMPPFPEEKLSSKDLAQIIIFIRSLSNDHG